MPPVPGDDVDWQLVTGQGVGAKDRAKEAANSGEAEDPERAAQARRCKAHCHCLNRNDVNPKL